MSEASPRIAFVCWNPFQYRHFEPVAAATPGAVFVVEVRPPHHRSFSDEILQSSPAPVVFWPRKRMHELDGLFDIVVCQTVFTHLHRFRRSKIAMLQYGYAKEPHNYGSWRSLSDVTLTYGPYASERLAPMCPTASVGVPRFDAWDQYRQRPAHSRRRPRLVYLPTWGPLSSLERYTDAIVELARHYDVTVKLHHNTLLLGDRQIRRRLRSHGLETAGPESDTTESLVTADVVLSDYSGAVFDAVYFNKPLVLLHQAQPPVDDAKFGLESLEHSKREQLGVVVERPDDVRSAVARALDAPRSEQHPLFASLFLPGPHATERAVEALHRLHAGEFAPSREHSERRREEMARSVARPRRLASALRRAATR